MQPTRDTRQLNWLLAWAVVFCDIGTSVYYVPGILYGYVHNAAPYFIVLTLIGFILLATKYIEISWRNPEGGGVVTIATKAMGPFWGCLGGMLIIVDYFLTTAISSVSGFHYIGSVLPFVDNHILLFAAAGLIILAVLNIIGIRESAFVSLVMAISALVIDIIVIGFAIHHMGWDAFAGMLSNFTQTASHLSWKEMLIGFSGAWLAFSGLESISQISGAMSFPLRKTTRNAMLAVIITITLTSPLLTTLSIGILSEATKMAHSERFISELAFLTSGPWIRLAVIMTASSLLLFASNTAIIGTYHVFLALGGRGFLPRIVTSRNLRFNTPHVAIVIATLIPILTLFLTQGHLSLLGDMYAFGLLGAFFFSSLSLDVIRWQIKRRGFAFWIGLVTTLMVLTAWIINLLEKDIAVIFGGTITAVGMLTAFGVRNNWFLSLAQKIPAIQRMQSKAFEASEDYAEEVIKDVVSISQAAALKPLYPSSTLIALRGENSNLIREGIVRAKGKGELALYCIYVEEWPGLFAGDTPHRPNDEGIRTLKFTLDQIKEKNIQVIPIWAVSYNAAEAIAKAARELNSEVVMVGTSRRSALYHMLRGHIVKGLAKKLPHSCRLMICN